LADRSLPELEVSIILIGRQQFFFREKEILMAQQKSKLRKQLKAAARKKKIKQLSRRPDASTSLGAKASVERRMIRRHQDVLQNVEFALVTAAREADNIDDSVIEQVLRLAIQAREPEDPKVQWTMDFLASIRDQRSDIDEGLWRDALSVIYASLKRHSGCNPGEMRYLNFIARYIPG
jgi:hypothetical protein